MLVLEGGYTDSTGRQVSAGDIHEMEAGSEHGFVVDPGGPCLAATRQAGCVFTNPVLRTLAKLLGR